MLELYRRENPTMQFMDGDPTGYSAMLGSFSQFESDHAGSSKPIEVFNVEEERRQEKLEQAQRKREQAVRERQQEEDQRKKAEAERAVWTAHHALLNEEAERRQADARKKAEDENVNLADYANAEIAIKYSQEAEEAWAQITNFPADLRRLFLTALDKDPRKDVPKLLSLVEGELKKRLRPFTDKAANNALEQARTISKEAAAEFIKVYDTLGGGIAAAKILVKIEREFEPSEQTITAKKIADASGCKSRNRNRNRNRNSAFKHAANRSNSVRHDESKKDVNVQELHSKVSVFSRMASVVLLHVGASSYDVNCSHVLKINF
jgi:hypothetical protein